MDRVHGQGPEEPRVVALPGGGGPPARTMRGKQELVHLAIAVGIGATLWALDFTTGRHGESALKAFAVRLAAWYEERRIPSVLCSPRKPVPYTQVDGVELEVPQCWRSERAELMDLDVHRFFDPVARAGTVSITAQSIEGPEDLEAYRKEFQTLAVQPNAILDGVSSAKSGEGAGPAREVTRHTAADSFAERIPAEQDASSEASKKDSLEGGAGGGDTFHRVESMVILGRTGASSRDPNAEGFATRPSEGSGPQRAWSWLLLSDRRAVRIVYTVREDWVGEAVVDAELKRVRAVAASVRPAGAPAPQQAQKTDSSR